MKRFILTGMPGSGKTAILRQLELEGYSVVEEAATDVIALEQARGYAEPWMDASFIDKVAQLQKERQKRASCQTEDLQFHDRSAVCTVALARYLGYPVSAQLQSELDRIRCERIYEPQVFFVRNLGFVTASAARRVSFKEALHFERIHEGTYQEFGFEIVSIQPGNVQERVAAIKTRV